MTTAQTVPLPPPQWWELSWLDGAFRQRRAEPHPDPLPGSWQRPLPDGVHPLAHHLGSGGTVLWTDGTLLPGVGDLTLPILSRAWLRTLAELQSPNGESGAAAHRHLRQDVLPTAQRHADPQWSEVWTDRGLQVQTAECGTWTLHRVQGRHLRALVFPFTVPNWAYEDLHTRPVRLCTEARHDQNTPVLLWPAERPLSDLLRAMTDLTTCERVDLTTAATRLAERFNFDLAHTPEQFDTPDVIRLHTQEAT